MPWPKLSVAHFMKEVSKVKQISSYYSIISHTYSQDKYPNLKFLSARPWWLLHRLAYLRSELNGLGNLFSFTPIWFYSFPIFNPGCFPGGLIQCPLHFYSPRNLQRQNSTLLFFPKKPKLDLNSTKGIQFQLGTMLLCDYCIEKLWICFLVVLTSWQQG